MRHRGEGMPLRVFDGKVVDTTESIEGALPALDAMVAGDLVAIERVEAVR